MTSQPSVAARQFHLEVAALLARIAPGSATVTCIGMANACAYAYQRSTADELPPAIWTARLEDVLTFDGVPEGHARVIDPATLGRGFAAATPGGQLAVVALAPAGDVSGIAGVERAAGEPAFSPWELAALGALGDALGLAARYAAILELELASASPAAPGKLELQLSRREREVAQLLVGGYANLNVAAHLGISENTIRTYIRRLYKKLNVCNRIDLIRAYEAAS